MDAFLTSIFAVILAEMGDRTQILCAALAIRFGRNVPVLAGLALASVINCAISAFGGVFIGGIISENPLRLFYAMSLLFAAIGMLAWRRRVDLLENWTLPPFWIAFIGIFILQFGDKSQFLLAATSARTGAWGFTLAGGWIGTMLACVPAILMQERLAELLPLNLIRWAGGVLFLFLGVILALSAWGIFG